MSKSVVSVFLVALLALSCNSARNLASIEPKSGGLEIPAKGELRVWKNTKHAKFDVVLTNANTSQSCEIYYVKSNGSEKWVYPSLLANSNLTVTIPADGHLFIKNFNPNMLAISYKISE